LLGHVEATLSRSFGELRLESFERNEPANAFDRKNGWIEAGWYFDEGSGVNKVVFTKPA
jgi:hypothetical protein